MSKLAAHTEDQQPAFSELVLHELDYRHSRETVTLAISESSLLPGLVLARNAQGEYEPLGRTGSGLSASACQRAWLQPEGA